MLLETNINECFLDLRAFINLPGLGNKSSIKPRRAQEAVDSETELSFYGINPGKILRHY